MENRVMSEDLSRQKRGTPLNPSQGESDTKNPQRPQKQQRQGAQEGEYKNVETSVNNPSYFDDDYAARQEDKISRDEAKRQKEDRTDESRQKH